MFVAVYLSYDIDEQRQRVFFSTETTMPYERRITFPQTVNERPQQVLYLVQPACLTERSALALEDDRICKGCRAPVQFQNVLNPPSLI